MNNCNRIFVRIIIRKCFFIIYYYDQLQSNICYNWLIMSIVINNVYFISLNNSYTFIALAILKKNTRTNFLN